MSKPLFIDHKMNQVTIGDERFYERKKDVYYPSVTWILSETQPETWALSEWKKSVGFNADIIMQRAGDEGTAIHDAMKAISSGVEISYDTFEESLKGNILLYRRAIYIWEMACFATEFLQKYVTEIIASEIKIFSDLGKYAGTIDLVCKIKDEVWLIDWKSSNSVYDSQFLQVCAYMQAWNEVNIQPGLIQIQKAGVLHLKSQTRTDGKEKDIQGAGWKLLEVPEYDSYTKQWNNYLDTFKFLKRKEIASGKLLPKTKILPLTLKK